jgi:type VI protein secretion system component VasK
MGAIALWFVESKVGRGIAIGFAAVVAVLAVLWRVFAAGKQAEKLADQGRMINDLHVRKTVHEDVQRLPSAGVDDELRKWSRPR